VSIELTENKRLAADAIFSARALKKLIFTWLVDQVPLFEAVCLATTLHVLSVPVLWVASWALPWPKSPVVTSVIEIDLTKWPLEAKSKKLFEFRDPGLNN